MELWLLFFPTIFFPLLAPVVILGLETHSVEVYSRDILPGLYGPMVDPIPEPSPLAAGCSY